MPPMGLGGDGTRGGDGTWGRARAGRAETVSNSLSESLDTSCSGAKAGLLRPMPPWSPAGVLVSPDLRRPPAASLPPAPLLLGPAEAASSAPSPSGLSRASGASGDPGAAWPADSPVRLSLRGRRWATTRTGGEGGRSRESLSLAWTVSGADQARGSWPARCCSSSREALPNRAVILARAWSRVSLGSGCRAVCGASERRVRGRCRGASRWPPPWVKILIGRYPPPRQGLTSRSGREMTSWGLDAPALVSGGGARTALEGVLIKEFLRCRSLGGVAREAPFSAFLGDDVGVLP